MGNATSSVYEIECSSVSNIYLASHLCSNVSLAHLKVNEDYLVNFDIICLLNFNIKPVETTPYISALKRLYFDNLVGCDNEILNTELDSYYLDLRLDLPAGDNNISDPIRARTLSCVSNTFSEYPEVDFENFHMYTVRNTVDLIGGYIDPNLINACELFKSAVGVSDIGQNPIERYSTPIGEGDYGKRGNRVKYLKICNENPVSRSMMSVKDYFGNKINYYREKILSISCFTFCLIDDIMTDLSILYSCSRQHFKDIDRWKFYNYRYNYLNGIKFSTSEEILLSIGLKSEDYTLKCMDINDEIENSEMTYGPYTDVSFHRFTFMIEGLVDRIRRNERVLFENYLLSVLEFRTIYWEDTSSYHRIELHYQDNCTNV